MALFAVVRFQRAKDIGHMKRAVSIVMAGLLLLSACSSTEDEESLGTSAEGSGGAGSGVPGPGDRGSGVPGGPGAGGIEQRTLQPMEVAREIVEVGDRVFFDYDSYNLDSEARATLERQASLLKSQPAIGVLIEGHCDERGTREYNLALGERRATSVRDYLVALGLTPNRIRTVSYGEERPAVVGSGADVWSQNRRAVTVVVGAAAGS